MKALTRSFAPFALAIAASSTLAVAAFPDTALATEVSESGTFRDASPSYPANGRAEIVRLQGGGFGVKLHGDFRVRNAPDLRIWLSEASNPRNADAVEARAHIDLGRLRSNTGEQIYRIPAGVDISDVESVVIWCRAFSSFFGAATLG